MSKTKSLLFVPTWLTKSRLAFLLFALALLTMPTAVTLAQSGEPELTIPDQVSASPNSQVTVPVTFTSNGHSINSMAFSVDYDETWLTLDPTDSNNDNIPDAVTIPAGFLNGGFDTSDTDGELDIAILVSGSLPDGLIASITFDVGNPGSTTEAAVGFSSQPSASFGSPSGGTVTGTTDDGSVLINPTPVADFTCDPTSGEAPLTVTCSDVSTGDITSWSWDFGDGTTSTDQNPAAHTYSANDTYNVTLTVTGLGGSDTESKSGYISVSSSPILTTTLQVEPSYVEMYVGQSMSLTLTIEETENLYGLEVTCATDATLLPFQYAAFGDFFGADALEGINALTQNSWHGALSQKNPAPALSGNGDFATLAVNAIATGTLELDCTPLVSNEDGFALPISALGSTITILQPPIGISGLSIYQSRQNHAGIQVSATGPTNKIATTLETGRFEFTELSVGSYEIKAESLGHLYNCIDNVQAPPGGATVLEPTKLLAGDVNGDHKINIFDATAVTDIFGQAPAPEKPTDFNADGKVDIFDLTPLGRNFNDTRLDSDNNPICTGW